MGKRHKRASRCIGCRLHAERCICASLAPVVTGTRVALVYHRRELRKTTNTGALALRMLPNSACFTWGEEGAEVPAEDLVPAGYRGVVLAHGADPLGPALVARLTADGSRVCLVVPDGSWRQATKMARRVPSVAALPRVSLPDGEETRYQLRTEPKEGGLATYEAIARAVGVIEGAAVCEALMRPFDALVAQTLAMRGRTRAAPPDAG